MNDRKLWDEIDFEKETLDEWTQFIDHILGQNNGIKIDRPVFGTLTIHQIADFIQKHILEIRDKLNSIKNGKKEKKKYLFAATEAQVIVNHLKKKIKEIERGLK